MAENSKPPGKYKELFVQKSESGKEAKKKRRKRQKQRANAEENQQYSVSQTQEHPTVSHEESSAENKQHSDETLKDILQATGEDQHILNAKMDPETTERSNQQDGNGDEDLNEINDELSLESSAKGEREENEDPNTLNTSSLVQQQSESTERSTLHQPENNKTAKFAGPLSLRRSKKRSKGKISSGQDRQEPKTTEGSEIPAADKKSAKGSDKETCEELAIKEEVKLEFGAATVQKDDVSSFKSPEGDPKKLVDKGHKGKTLKQLASFGRNKKKAGITASYSRTSLEDENLDIEAQKQTNEETIRSDTEEASGGLHGNLLQEPVTGKSDLSNQGIIDRDQAHEENQEKGKKTGTKPGLKKSKSYVRILRKKSLKDDEKQRSEKQMEKSSKSNDSGGDKPLEAPGTKQEILHEQNTEAIQSNREIAEPQAENICMVQDDAGDEETEGVEIKQTSSKKERKESLLRRQFKKLKSPNKDEEDKEKNNEDEARNEGGEHVDEGDNGLDKNDLLSADNEITKPVKRKKSGLRNSLSRALKRKKKTNEDAQEQVGGTDDNEQEDPNKATTEETEIPEIQEKTNSYKPSLDVLAGKQTQVESEEMDKFSKEGKTLSDDDNQDRSIKLHELKAKENKEESIPNKETTGDQSEAMKSQEQQETASLESVKSEDVKRTEDEITSEAQEMGQKMMKIITDEVIAYVEKKEALTTVESLAIEDHNGTSSKQEDNQTEEGPKQVNEELATKELNQEDDGFEERKSWTNKEMADSPNQNQEKSGGVEMTENQEEIVSKEEREGTSSDNSPESKQVRQQNNSSGYQNDERHNEEEKESSLQSNRSEDELQTEEKMINEARQANKKLMEVVIEELTKFMEDKTSSAEEEQKADTDTDDKEVRAVGERHPTATGSQELHNDDFTIENPDIMLEDTTFETDVSALERKKNEEKRKVTEDLVDASSCGSERGTNETKNGYEEKGAGKRSIDRSASVEKSLTTTPRSPKEEWIVVDQLDISLEISRQLKHVLGFEDRTVSCCTVM